MGLQAAWRSADARLTLSGDLRLVDGNKDSEFFDPTWVYPISTLPQATTVNIAANYKLNDQVTLSGRITNLFDKKNSDAWGYHAQGRTAWVGLSADF